MTYVLTTNNGTHTADQWGMGTASIIFDTTDHKSIAADHMKLNIAELLSKHYRDMLMAEKQALETNPDHAISEYKTDATEVVSQISSMARNTSFNEFINRPDWLKHAGDTIATHFATAQHVERLWFAEKNQDNVAAQQYKARFQQIGEK